MMRFKLPLILLLGLAVIGSACGGDDEVEIRDVWARASANMQNAGAVYMEISGADGGADRLESASVSSTIAAMAQLHESSMDAAGVMTMQQVQAIDIPAGQTVMLAPGGYHIMLMNLAEPLVVGTEVDVTLSFANAGEITVTAEVREI